MWSFSPLLSCPNFPHQRVLYDSTSAFNEDFQSMQIAVSLARQMKGCIYIEAKLLD